MKDAADMWIHEGFTNYSENLFVEYHFGKKEAEDYVIGSRALVQNRSPIIGTYGLNNVRVPATCITKAETCCTRFVR